MREANERARTTKAPCEDPEGFLKMWCPLPPKGSEGFHQSSMPTLHRSFRGGLECAQCNPPGYNMLGDIVLTTLVIG